MCVFRRKENNTDGCLQAVAPVADGIERQIAIEFGVKMRKIANPLINGDLEIARADIAIDRKIVVLVELDLRLPEIARILSMMG